MTLQGAWKSLSKKIRTGEWYRKGSGRIGQVSGLVPSMRGPQLSSLARLPFVACSIETYPWLQGRAALATPRALRRGFGGE
jgi:hypothetical protein